MLSLSVDIWRPVVSGASQSLTAQVQALFAGRAGGMWDMGDIATLFQDTAGSTPVTAVTQPIGRVNDKSGLGNHATQSTAGSQPLFSARKNLLTKTEQFSDGAWLKLSSGTGVVPAVTDNYGVAPDGTTTAARVQLDLGATPATAVSRIFQGSGALGAGNWRNSLWVKTADGSTKTIYLVGSSTLSENVFVVNSAWQQLLPTEATAGAYAQIQLGLDGALAVSNTADLLVWHPQVELGTTTTTYQRVNTSSDYDTVGFPAFAQFDGTDDALLFPAITFGGAFNTFVAGKVTSGTQGVHLWRTADVNGTWAKYKSGDATTPTGTGSGSPTYAVNGTALSPSQQGQLYTQINGVDCVVESIGVVLTAETALQFSGFAGSLFTGNAHRVLMISGTLTAAEKLLCRRWAAEGNGVTVV